MQDIYHTEPSDLKIGFGGGCHWCTEAVFQSLKGVTKVKQGYLASTDSNNSYSEGIIVHYKPEIVSIFQLVKLHLHTHQATSNHSFRDRYRSAVYYFDELSEAMSVKAINSCQADFEEEIITKVLPFYLFKASRDSIQDYYLKNPEAPFCKKYIVPKLEKVQAIINTQTYQTQTL